MNYILTEENNRIIDVFECKAELLAWTNEFIKEFNSIAQAVTETGTRHSSIYACCVGKYKTANGFLWKYV